MILNYLPCESGLVVRPPIPQAANSCTFEQVLRALAVVLEGKGVLEQKLSNHQNGTGSTEWRLPELTTRREGADRSQEHVVIGLPRLMQVSSWTAKQKPRRFHPRGLSLRRVLKAVI